jgi:hypothetical protein
MTDARFEDGDDRALRLIAQSADDLPPLSALVQDAVFPITEMTFDRRRRRFAVLLNRYRWETPQARERVQAMLTVEGVLTARTMGIDRQARDTVLSVLSLDWTPGADGGGDLALILAGDGAVALRVEALDLALADVTRPYAAPSGKVPSHD